MVQTNINTLVGNNFLICSLYVIYFLILSFLVIGLYLIWAFKRDIKSNSEPVGSADDDLLAPNDDKKKKRSLKRWLQLFLYWLELKAEQCYHENPPMLFAILFSIITDLYSVIIYAILRGYPTIFFWKYAIYENSHPKYPIDFIYYHISQWFEAAHGFLSREMTVILPGWLPMFNFINFVAVCLNIDKVFIINEIEELRKFYNRYPNHCIKELNSSISCQAMGSQRYFKKTMKGILVLLEKIDSKEGSNLKQVYIKNIINLMHPYIDQTTINSIMAGNNRLLIKLAVKHLYRLGQDSDCISCITKYLKLTKTALHMQKYRKDGCKHV
jgi:hypothetical protein